MPIKPGMTVKDAELQVTTGIDPNKPLLNTNAFYVPQIPGGTPGTPCTTVSGVQTCDNLATASARRAAISSAGRSSSASTFRR